MRFGGNRVVAGRKYELSGRCAAPQLESALESTELGVGILVRILGLKPLEQLDCCSIRFVLKPAKNARPHRIERILARSPVAPSFRVRLVSRPHLAVVPRRSEPLQKASQVFVAMGNDMEDLSSGEAGQLMLGRADLVEQPKRIELAPVWWTPSK